MASSPTSLRMSPHRALLPLLPRRPAIPHQILSMAGRSDLLDEEGTPLAAPSGSGPIYVDAAPALSFAAPNPGDMAVDLCPPALELAMWLLSDVDDHVPPVPAVPAPTVLADATPTAVSVPPKKKAQHRAGRQTRKSKVAALHGHAQPPVATQVASRLARRPVSLAAAAKRLAQLKEQSHALRVRKEAALWLQRLQQKDPATYRPPLALLGAIPMPDDGQVDVDAGLLRHTSTSWIGGPARYVALEKVPGFQPSGLGDTFYPPFAPGVFHGQRLPFICNFYWLRKALLSHGFEEVPWDGRYVPRTPHRVCLTDTDSAPMYFFWTLNGVSLAG
jgi:hypothetical protein